MGTVASASNTAGDILGLHHYALQDDPVPPVISRRHRVTPDAAIVEVTDLCSRYHSNTAHGPRDLWLYTLHSFVSSTLLFIYYKILPSPNTNKSRIIPNPKENRKRRTQS